MTYLQVWGIPEKLVFYVHEKSVVAYREDEYGVQQLLKNSRGLVIQANKLRTHQTLNDFPGHVGRKTIIKKLIKRYNYENKLPCQKTMRLPVSGTMVKITCHGAKATFQRLLTDPRLKGKDYLYFDRNPLAPPPENLDYVADLNTGLAFRDTYAMLVTNEGQQVMPVTIKKCQK